jgi:hypothetical protein
MSSNPTTPPAPSSPVLGTIAQITTTASALLQIALAAIPGAGAVTAEVEAVVSLVEGALNLLNTVHGSPVTMGQLQSLRLPTAWPSAPPPATPPSPSAP